jgi:arsenate reductase
MFDTHDVTIFHNPVCSKSRGALAILDEQSIDHEVIEYLVTPPSRATLETIIERLDSPASALVRTGDKKFHELGLDKASYDTPSAVIDLLVEHHELMERPVVIRGNRAVIARPSERVHELLS